MTDCCEDKSCEVSSLRERHSGALKAVLAINAVMFFVEAASGYWSRSTALMGDSLDMLGDALSYSTSLYVLNKGERQNAFAALLKGVLMLLLGSWVLGNAVMRASEPSLPIAETMGIVGALALFANLTCLGLLWKSRADNLNMHSVWLCSRNDIIVNVGVIFSAFAVKVTQSKWPDLMIGVVIAAIILKSSVGVLQKAYWKIRQNPI